MALSNWDTLAVNEKGESITGVFKNGKYTVEIYKNWLYVSEAKKKYPMEITHGKVRIDNMNILAVRGPQEGVFCIVWAWNHKKQKDGTTKGEVKMMAGCGVSGYKDKIGEILTSKGLKRKKDDNWCECSDSEGNRWIENFDLKKGKIRQKIQYWSKEDGEYDYGDDWCGVNEESLAFLQKMFAKWNKEENAGIGDIFKKTPLRYNQGDKYISDHLGGETAATKVGEKTTPVLIGALKEFGKKGKKGKKL